MSGYAYWGGFHFWWIFPLMMFFCFLFMRGYGRHMRWYGPFQGPGESPMDILNKRYARGEIDQPEYDEKRKALESVLRPFDHAQDSQAQARESGIWSPNPDLINL